MTGKKRLRSLHPFVKQERGNVLVMVAIFMVVILGMAALVIDGGRLYAEKSTLQNAVDAAALAGAQELPMLPAKAKEKAVEAAGLNGVTISVSDVTVSDSNMKIRVEAKRLTAMTFAQVLGISDPTVGAVASAKLHGPISEAKGVIPLGVDSEYLTSLLKDDPHPDATLKVANWKDGSYGPGQFGLLNLDCINDDCDRSKNNLDQYLKSGYPGTIEVGDDLGLAEGGKTGIIDHSLEDKIFLVPVIEPIIEVNPKNGKEEVIGVTVVGFAAFLITNIDGKIVTGEFIEYAKSGPTDPSLPSFGVVSYRLVE